MSENISPSKKEPFKIELERLAGDNEKAVLSTINELRKKGNEKTTRAIVALLITSNNEDVKSAVMSYLFDLKDEQAVQPIMDAITNPSYSAYKAQLISVFWESALDASDHLVTLVEQLENANYNETLEILTVIENFDGPFNEEEVFECIAMLNEFMESAETEEQRTLILSLIEVLNNF